MLSYKKLEQSVILGNLSLDIMRNLSQEKINYLLFFAYKNNKLETVEKLLTFWKIFKFSKGNNILTLIIDNIVVHENTIKQNFKINIKISNEDLNYYKKLVDELKESINTPVVQNRMKEWSDLFQYKMIENLSKRLNNSLEIKGNKKLVKL